MIQKTEVDMTIAEIHKTRERLAAKFGGDIDAILEDARKRERTSGHPIWHQKTEATSPITSSADAKCSPNPNSLID